MPRQTFSTSLSWSFRRYSDVSEVTATPSTKSGHKQNGASFFPLRKLIGEKARRWPSLVDYIIAGLREKT